MMTDNQNTNYHPIFNGNRERLKVIIFTLIYDCGNGTQVSPMNYQKLNPFLLVSLKNFRIEFDFYNNYFPITL